MLKENLKDAGDILQNILTQSLSIPGAKEDINLLEAAQAFNSKEAIRSDFRKIMMSFLQFQEPTKALIQELELLQKDLQL